MKTFTAAIIIAFALQLMLVGCGGGNENSGGGTPQAPVETPTAATPVFSPATGTFTQAQTVSISTSTPGATIFYTSDGSTPTAASEKYTGAMTMSATCTVKAFAIAPAYRGSAIASATYTITPPPPLSTSYTWKNVQIIAGGFITGINFHPAQQGLIYARTDIGGAYRWDNFAQRWIPLTDWIGFTDWNYLGIESIGLDPSDPKRLYLAGGTYTASWAGHGAMLISTDQGDTFQIVPMPFRMGGNDDGRFAGERLAVDPNLGSKLYFGSRLNGLWTSADHGAHWSQVTNFPVTGATNGAGVVFVDFVASSGPLGSATPTIYVGVSDTGTHLYRSTDAGATWTAVPGQPSNQGLYPNHGVFGPDGNLYLSYGDHIGPNGMTAGTVYRYTPPNTNNPNGTWTYITPPKTPYEGWNGTGYPHGYGTVVVDPQRPGTIMVSTMDLWYYHDGLLRSTDGGNTWIDLGESSVRDSSLAPYVNFGGTSAAVGNWIGAMAIDPFNSDHVLYGTGGMIWASNDATVAEPGSAITGFQVLRANTTHWTIGALGIEETATMKLISPTIGAHLVSALGDVGGFVHTDLTVSPPSGMLNPRFTTTSGLDFAEKNASVIARIGDVTPFGAYSSDGGATWTGFATKPGVTGSGSIAVSADGDTFVWATGDGATAYSTDHGTTWTVSAGAPAFKPVWADRNNARKFYVLDATGKALYVSTDHGAHFTAVNSALPGDSSDTLAVSPTAEGDLWLVTRAGLFHSTDSGTTFTNIGTVQEGYGIGFGKAAATTTYPALYLAGKVNGTQAIFRSTDAGTSWVRINDDQHQWGWISVIIGDPRVFGRLYLGANGRGIIYGDSAN